MELSQPKTPGLERVLPATTDLRGRKVSEHLDLLRGVAAFAVLYSHARVLLLSSATGGPTPAWDRALVILSGYGYSAVMVFFVLSGYLIAGSVIRAVRDGRWSWRSYLLARGTRLYVVLLPALVLTALCSQLALSAALGLTANSDTAVAIIDVGQIRAHSGLWTWIGNAFFLQTILVPTYGSNTALWSLANEFWYYLIFPCLWLALRGKLLMWQRGLYAAAGAAMLWFVGPKIAGYFPTWLIGAALVLAPGLSVSPGSARRMVALTLVPLLAVLCLVGIRRIPSGFAADYAVAAAFALFLYAILQGREPAGSGWYARTALLMAGCSYTLYATHLPMLVLLRSWLTFERPWPHDLLHWAGVLAACMLVAACAFALSRVTEARTTEVRRWLAKRLGEGWSRR